MSGEPQPGEARFVSRQRELRFRNPVHVVSAQAPIEVIPALRRVHSAVSGGAFAAGFITYEAAPGFDPALSAHPPSELPLLWFGIYNGCEEIPSPAQQPRAPAGAFHVGAWEPLVAQPEYRDCIRRIRAFIEAGHTYQVNYTFPLRTTFSGSPAAWFDQLCRAQAADHAAYVNAGRFHVLSASPELFFRLTGDRLEARPMKGTRPRGRWTDEDRALAAELAHSEKDRAENAMIVDLLRNDVGRVAHTGSVQVERLFEVERYPTVWQMTSTIVSRTSAPVPDILAALFPSGSVTGAPKVRTMQIIRELEPFPRGIYCGSVGWWAPDRRAEFNVAIRTVTLDTHLALATYGVGGGITWDSTPEGEYDECRAKSAVLSTSRPEFQLLETILLDGDCFLLRDHLQRLADSAEYFGFSIDLAAVERTLLEKAAKLRGLGPQKLRLLVAHDGSFRVQAEPAPPPRPLRVALAPEPVDPRDVFLYHKTTARQVYDRLKAARPDCDDVILWNPAAEITESTLANVVLELGGELLTPPVRCGLLNGTMRRRLLADGRIREAVLTKDDLRRARAVHLVNSVRKWIDTILVD